MSSATAAAAAAAAAPAKHTAGAATSSSSPTPTSAHPLPTFETLALSWVGEGVVQVALARADKSNAMNRAMWRELTAAFAAVADIDFPARAVLLVGSGRNFTAGLDLGDHMAMFSPPADGGEADVGRRALRLRDTIRAPSPSLPPSTARAWARAWTWCAPPTFGTPPWTPGSA